MIYLASNDKVILLRGLRFDKDGSFYAAIGRPLTWGELLGKSHTFHLSFGLERINIDKRHAAAKFT